MIRKVIREGRAKGISGSDVLMYAKISAHSGIDIQFDKEATNTSSTASGPPSPQGEGMTAEYADGFYEASQNRIVVNPEGKRTAERLLIHELDHAIRKGIGKDGATKIYLEAIEGVDASVREKILQKYKKTATPGEAAATVMDETNAYYAEQVLSNRNTLEKLIEAEPGLKDKILSFFKGASADYADVPRLSGSAKWYYKKFKKMFDEFSAKNAQANANEKPLTNINQGNMHVSDRQYAHSIDADLLDFINSVDSMKNKSMVSKRKHSLGKVSENHARIIEKVLSSELNINIDASEYSINIDGGAIQHIEEKHGVNGTSDHSMSDKEDIARIGWVVNNADGGYIARTQTGEIDYSYHFKNDNNTPSPKIMLQKNIGDDTFVVAECVPDRKTKVIHIISARKIKSGNGQVLNVENDVSPQPTSKTPLDGITAIDSISQSEQKSNSSDEISLENSSDKQFALDIDSESEVSEDGRISGAEVMGWLKDKPKSDGKLDLEKTVARGLPYKSGKSSLTVGEIKKLVANSTREKVYSKADALKVVNRMSGTWGLTVKARDEIADTIWQFLNEAPDVEYRQDMAHDIAEYIAPHKSKGHRQKSVTFKIIPSFSLQTRR